mgnify:CR=1 FL=1
MKREDIKKIFPDATEEQLKGCWTSTQRISVRRRESLKQ